MDENANLGMIKDLIKHFPQVVPGYSDHTLPKQMDICKSATLLGAAVIEKHFTHDKTLPGNDHYHAMDKNDLMHFNGLMNELFAALGSFKITSIAGEEKARQNARRSLVAIKNIADGETITKEHLTWKRPAHGISPRFIEDLIGKKSLRAIQEDEVLQWNMFS
jgi:N-acetylneuraminate synthase